MSRFRLKTSIMVNVLLALCLVVAVYVIVTTAITLSGVPTVNVFRIVTLSLIIALFAFLLVVVSSVLFYQYYVIKDGKLKVCLGIIVVSYSIEDISELIFYKDKEKLVMYYGKDKFTIILLSQDKHEEFMKALREVNSAIIYDNKVNEND